MQYVTKESLQDNRNSVPHEDVTTRVGVFRCAGMTCLELQQYRLALPELANKDYIPAMLIILGCKDADGKHLFVEGDMTWLIQLGADVTEPVINAILRLSGVGEDANDEILKNSAAAQADVE